MTGCVACGLGPWTTHPGCARPRISGSAASSHGSRCPPAVGCSRHSPDKGGNRLGKRLGQVSSMQSLGKVGGIALLLVAALPAWAVDWTKAQTVTVVTSD